MAFPHLLPAACGVELDHLHVERIVEVGYARVVECKMTVLADPQATEIERVEARSPA